MAAESGVRRTAVPVVVPFHTRRLRLLLPHPSARRRRAWTGLTKKPPRTFQSRPCDEERFSIGGADLRHLEGTGIGQAFPTGAETGIRIDLFSTATRIEARHRIAAVISADGEFEYRGSPYQPNIQIGGGRHIVIPLAEGTLGGSAPDVEYPPRPRID